MFQMTTISVRNYFYRKILYYSNITNFREIAVVITAQKIKFSSKYFLVNVTKPLMENFIFCAVYRKKHQRRI